MELFCLSPKSIHILNNHLPIMKSVVSALQGEIIVKAGTKLPHPIHMRSSGSKWGSWRRVWISVRPWSLTEGQGREDWQRLGIFCQHLLDIYVPGFVSEGESRQRWASRCPGGMLHQEHTPELNVEGQNRGNGVLNKQTDCVQHGTFSALPSRVWVAEEREATRGIRSWWIWACQIDLIQPTLAVPLPQLQASELQWERRSCTSPWETHRLEGIGHNLRSLVPLSLCSAVRLPISVSLGLVRGIS